ncbi:MFS transporter [Streptomyces puniciscabiei]
MATDRAQHTGARTAMALLPSATALSMLQLFLISAFGPVLVGALDLSPLWLGLVPMVGFSTATLLSVPSARLVHWMGPRRCLMTLLAGSAASLAIFSTATGYGALLISAAICGLCQALTNPAANELILQTVPPRRQGLATGLKSCGVQGGALLAGLPLAALAGWLGWRSAPGVAAVAAAAATVCAYRWLRALPTRSVHPTPHRLARPDAGTAWMVLYSLLLGAGLSATTVYLPLFAHERLGLSTHGAAALTAVASGAAVIGQVLWSRLAHCAKAAGGLPLALAGLSAIAGIGIVVSCHLGTWVVVLATIGIGLFATAANAVVNVVIIRWGPPGRCTSATAYASMGKFAGFALGPPVFGCLAHRSYATGWFTVTAAFLAAAITATVWWLRHGPSLSLTNPFQGVALLEGRRDHAVRV